jgi:L-2-hydroxyglutarate oxidase
MLKTGTSGVRAQGMSPEGELLMDFKIEKIDNQIHILNAPSPGATASLAIANYIINNFIEK